MLEWHYLISAEFCKYLRNIVIDVITLPENLYTTRGLLFLLHGVISLPDVMSYDKLC